MDITEVRIKLMEEPGERLKAFCSITFDNCFVVRDLKIIEGTSGPFVAMPSRKLTSHCSKCGMKNHLRAVYCNQCGQRVEGGHMPKDAEGRAKLYADIAHPINSRCREMIQDRVISEFSKEIELAKEPGYVSRYDEFDFEPDDTPRKPTRVDQPHTQEAAQSHTPPQPPAGEPTTGSNKPHFPSEARASGKRAGSSERSQDGGFGEGIF